MVKTFAILNAPEGSKTEQWWGTYMQSGDTITRINCDAKFVLSGDKPGIEHMPWCGKTKVINGSAEEQPTDCLTNYLDSAQQPMKFTCAWDGEGGVLTPTGDPMCKTGETAADAALYGILGNGSEPVCNNITHDSGLWDCKTDTKWNNADGCEHNYDFGHAKPADCQAACKKFSKCSNEGGQKRLIPIAVYSTKESPAVIPTGLDKTPLWWDDVQTNWLESTGENPCDYIGKELKFTGDGSGGDYGGMAGSNDMRQWPVQPPMMDCINRGGVHKDGDKDDCKGDGYGTGPGCGCAEPTRTKNVCALMNLRHGAKYNLPETPSGPQHGGGEGCATVYRDANFCEKANYLWNPPIAGVGDDWGGTGCAVKQAQFDADTAKVCRVNKIEGIPVGLEIQAYNDAGGKWYGPAGKMGDGITATTGGGGNDTMGGCMCGGVGICGNLDGEDSRQNWRSPLANFEGSKLVDAQSWNIDPDAKPSRPSEPDRIGDGNCSFQFKPTDATIGSKVEGDYNGPCQLNSYPGFCTTDGDEVIGAGTNEHALTSSYKYASVEAANEACIAAGWPTDLAGVTGDAYPIGKSGVTEKCHGYTCAHVGANAGKCKLALGTSFIKGTIPASDSSKFNCYSNKPLYYFKQKESARTDRQMPPRLIACCSQL